MTKGFSRAFYMAAASALALLAGGALDTASAQTAEGASQAAALMHFSIPAQPMARALMEYSRQARVAVSAPSDVVAGHTAHAIEGDMSPEAALSALLEGSGLSYTRTGSSGFAVQDPNVPTQLGDATGAAPSDEAVSEEITVIGTNIRGVYPASSPVQIYSAEDIARTGATTTEQFIQKLPQNMGTLTQYSLNAASGPGNGNEGSVAGVDLRGLGEGTSLVLMNGRRLGLADFGRTADVSLIPASAIARVEVLTDGASAIYGSDAVGGVVNFLLRDDFDGAETRVSYGGVSNGNLRQGDFTQTFGRSWGSGHALASFSTYAASALDVADRGFAAGLDRGQLTPIEQRDSLLLSASQDFGDSVKVSADLALSRRETKGVTTDTSSTDSANWTLATNDDTTDQIFANLAFDYEFSSSLHGNFTATYDQTNTVDHQWMESYRQTPPTFQLFARRPKDYDALDLTATLDGALFTLPGGATRFSIGAGYFNEEYSGIVPPATPSSRTLARTTTYAFGELNLPFISAEQNIPLVHRLELNVAARYTRYDDQSRPALHQEFGDATDPKIGLLWAPTRSLALRGTYGSSFRAPSLVQLDDTSAFLSILTRPLPFPTGPVASILAVANRPAPDLSAETATTYTLGFDIRPPNHPRFRISATYYNISYEDRIGAAPIGANVFQAPQLYPLALYRAPSAAFIAQLVSATKTFFSFPSSIDVSNPTAAAQAILNLSGGNVWIFDRRIRNLALSEQDGFDFSISDSADTPWGDVRYGADITDILSYRQQAASTELVHTVVDMAAQPVDLRIRAYIGVSRGGFDGTLSINYVDDYRNVSTSSTGVAPIESWTTADLSISYEMPDAGLRLAEGVRFTLSVQNLFDQDPPFVAGGSPLALFSPSGFDPKNANPLGRIVVIGLTKSW